MEDEEESDVYTITILDKKVSKIEKYNGVNDNYVKTTYTYEYDIDDLELPSLNDYPLKVNN